MDLLGPSELLRAPTRRPGTLLIVPIRDARDDDDSADSPAPTPTGETELEPPTDCGCSGCGVHYSKPVGGALLLIGLVGLRRDPGAGA